MFTVVVDAFGKLDDTKSPLFAKRVSMLETIAKVRSCVLMLDLDCDDLIQETFTHFFRIIRCGTCFSLLFSFIASVYVILCGE